MTGRPDHIPQQNTLHVQNQAKTVGQSTRPRTIDESNLREKVTAQLKMGNSTTPRPALLLQVDTKI